MKKPTEKDFPMLKKAWDEYGFQAKWEDLTGIKADRGCYAVVCYPATNVKSDKPLFEMADFARAGIEEPWEVQNDGFSLITEAQWNKLKIKPECDWFEIDGKMEW